MADLKTSLNMEMRIPLSMAETEVETQDDQKALDYILNIFKKNDSIEFGNMIGFLPKEIDPLVASEVFQNLYLDGWFIQKPTVPVSPWLVLSSYGKAQLKKGYHPVFLDPDSTVSDIKISIPNIDSIALDYFQESLFAIKKRLYLSASVTMGCASEQSILLLIEAVVAHYKDPALTSDFEKRHSIKNKFQLLIETIRNRGLKAELLNTFSAYKDKCDSIKRLFIDIDTTLDQMFSIYRINRNDAGHPTGMNFDEDVVKATAAMFKRYCGIIYGLISYL